MDSIDSLYSALRKVGKGEDEKGKYKVFELVQELSCECHAETCSHLNGTKLYYSRYKQYKDGTRESIPLPAAINY